MILIDTHSHIYDPAFDEDRSQALERAIEAGVRKIILPAIDREADRKLFELCNARPEICVPLIGLHPTSVNDNDHYKEELAFVRECLDKPTMVPDGFRGIGEVGLDLYWSTDFLERQLEVFRAQTEWAIELELPLIIHTRSAWPQMREVLSEYRGRGVKGILHSFSGTADDFEAISGYGDFYAGIGGPVTYKKSELPNILSGIPLERLVLETDCPYLPPVPFRGKRNETSYLTYICDKLAELYAVEPGEIARVTTANACSIFNLELTTD